MACNRFRNRGRESLRSSLRMSAKTKWIDICKTRSCTPWLDHALNGSIMPSMARSVDHALHCLIRHSVARSCTQWLDHALHGSIMHSMARSVDHVLHGSIMHSMAQIMHSMARSCTPWLDHALHGSIVHSMARFSRDNALSRNKQTAVQRRVQRPCMAGSERNEM